MSAQLSPDDPDNEWAEVQGLVDLATRHETYRVVQERADDLADRFYAELFRDGRAAAILDHDLVNTRLRTATARWLVQLFDPAVAHAELDRTQRRTGEVHARIGVPVQLVGRGARVLKREICNALTDDSRISRSALAAAMQYVHELFAVAVDAMTSAFSANSSRIERSEEAYRLFFLGQDMKAERERRRSELMEWARQVLDRYYWDDQPVAEPWVAHSPFGLWMQHKASILFEGAPEITAMRAEIGQVERRLLPALRRVRSNHNDAKAIVVELNGCFERIKTMLGALFDRYIAMDDGRDSVTTLLNRRYFPVVAKREIELARVHGTVFAALLIDIDGLRVVADRGGMEAANMVLNQTAERLGESVRAGDFVFRIGDDEFLVLLVEVDPASTAAIAEGLRQRIAGQPFRVGAGETASLTVSIGIALFDGHPDYQHLLDRADRALREAKQAGRNRCAQAD